MALSATKAAPKTAMCGWIRAAEAKKPGIATEGVDRGAGAAGEKCQGTNADWWFCAGGA